MPSASFSFSINVLNSDNHEKDMLLFITSTLQVQHCKGYLEFRKIKLSNFWVHLVNHLTNLQCRIDNFLWFIVSVQMFDGITKQPVCCEEVRRLSQVLARCYRVARDDNYHDNAA